MNSLLEHKADPNIKNNRGDSAYDLAKKNKHEQIMQVLKDHGAIDLQEFTSERLSGTYANQTGEKNGRLIVRRLSGNKVELSLKTTDYMNCTIEKNNVMLTWSDYQRRFEGKFEEQFTRNGKSRKEDFRLEFRFTEDKGVQCEIDGYCGAGRYFKAN